MPLFQFIVDIHYPDDSRRLADVIAEALRLHADYCEKEGISIPWSKENEPIVNGKHVFQWRRPLDTKFGCWGKLSNNRKISKKTLEILWGYGIYFRSQLIKTPVEFLKTIMPKDLFLEIENYYLK